MFRKSYIAYFYNEYAFKQYLKKYLKLSRNVRETIEFLVIFYMF
jgi:hypothetical protein